MLSAKVIREYNKRWPEYIQSINKVFLPEAGTVLQQDASRRINNVTGTLSNSIGFKVRGDEVSVGTNVEYAPYVEYGTSRSKPYPYLRPALDSKRRELVGRWRNLFRKVFRAAGKL